MKRILGLLITAALLMTACAARQNREDRAEALQSRYAGLTSCTARVEAAAVKETETLHFTLDAVRSGDATRVSVLAPEELAGVAATVRRDGGLTLEFDGMVIDAGSALPGVSALDAFDIVLDAAARGYVTERSMERFGDVGDALRLCFETERSGKKLLVTVYFDDGDRPLYAEIEHGGEILAYLEFTSFSFGDILAS